MKTGRVGSGLHAMQQLFIGYRLTRYMYAEPCTLRREQDKTTAIAGNDA